MNIGAEPYPPATSTHDTGSLGSAKGRPSGPTMSTWSWRCSRESHSVPLPWVANTTSTVPPYTPRLCTLWIENARRSSIDELGPPTASATKWPGRA